MCTRPARMVSSALTDRWDDPAEVCRWLSGPWGAPLLAFPLLYPCLPPQAAPQPACSYLSQWRTLTEKGTWLLAWDRRGGGSKLYSCHNPLGMPATCCAICFVFRQAGSVFTYGTDGNTSNEPAVPLKKTKHSYCAFYLLSHTQGGPFPLWPKTDTLSAQPYNCWQ